MQLTHTDYLLWAVSTGLQAVLFAVMAWTRFYRRLPYFSLYVAIVLAADAYLWYAYHKYGFASAASFTLAWSLQGITLGPRGLAVGELCRRALSPYRGVWALAWRLLTGAAILLLVYAGLASYSSRTRVATFILTAERGLELAAAVLLLLLLAISHYYRIEILVPERLLIYGLCAWSLVQVLNDVAWQVLASRYFQWANKIHVISYQVTVAVWIYAVLRPVTAEQPQPAMNAALYNRVAPAVNVRLQALNNRLLEIFKG